MLFGETVAGYCVERTAHACKVALSWRCGKVVYGTTLFKFRAGLAAQRPAEVSSGSCKTCRPTHATILVTQRDMSVRWTEVAKCVAAFWKSTKVNQQVLWGVPPFLRCSFHPLFYLPLCPHPLCFVHSWQYSPKRTCATVRLSVSVAREAFPWQRSLPADQKCCRSMLLTVAVRSKRSLLHEPHVCPSLRVSSGRCCCVRYALSPLSFASVRLEGCCVLGRDAV